MAHKEDTGMGKDPITRPGRRDDGPGNATSRPVGRELPISGGKAGWLGESDDGIERGSAKLPKR